jgi:hypothetical protein
MVPSMRQTHFKFADHPAPKFTHGVEHASSNKTPQLLNEASLARSIGQKGSWL